LAYANFISTSIKTIKAKKEKESPRKESKEYEEYVEELVGFFACLTIYHF
jgi:hypothetical protein